MKKIIYKVVFSLTASLFAFAPMTFAQTSAEGIVLNKTVTQDPDENGVRWITLESYVTGAVKVTTKSVPSDVLLVLDLSTSMKEDYGGISRLAALQNAATAFVGNIYDNAVSARQKDSKYDGNRIGIITFYGGVTDNTNGWKDVEKDGNVTKSGDTYSGTLIDTINGFSTSTSGTWTSSGLRVAIDNYLDGTPNSKRDGANLTVVVFTDGEPATGPNKSYTIDGKSVTGTTNNFSSYIANNAVYYANILKNTYSAKVFTVTLLGTYTGSDAKQKEGLVKSFAQLMSSNYPSANAEFQSTNTWTYSTSTGLVSATNLTYGAANTDGVKYWQNVDADTDLTSIFESIADQSGGSASPIKEDAVVEVDIVSNSFALPSGSLAKDYEPKIYVAKCTGYDDDGKGNAFGSEKYIENKENNMTNIDGSTSTIKLTVKGNEISTTGFDFAKNYCGRRYKDEEGKQPYADGYKLIVKIPIEINENAVGGAGTATNEAGSGIKVDGELVAEFPQPTITLPVNLWVMKTGLSKYENAHFSVYRCKVGSDGKETTYDTTPYTTFVLTGGLNETTLTAEDGKSYTGPLLKLQGLDSGYHYKVVEESWSWQYQGTPVTKVTTYELTANPVVFVNNQIDTDVLHAESKVSNDFNKATANTYSSKHYKATTE